MQLRGSNPQARSAAGTADRHAWLARTASRTSPGVPIGTVSAVDGNAGSARPALATVEPYVDVRLARPRRRRRRAAAARPARRRTRGVTPPSTPSSAASHVDEVVARSPVPSAEPPSESRAVVLLRRFAIAVRPRRRRPRQTVMLARCRCRGRRPTSCSWSWSRSRIAQDSATGCAVGFAGGLLLDIVPPADGRPVAGPSCSPWLAGSPGRPPDPAARRALAAPGRRDRPRSARWAMPVGPAARRSPGHGVRHAVASLPTRRSTMRSWPRSWFPLWARWSGAPASRGPAASPGGEPRPR